MDRSKIIRQRSRDQITIPVEFRRELGLTEGSVLKVTLDGKKLHIEPLLPEDQDDNRDWLRAL
jgi:AbrB family looped-hinge helix DNA binding protein